MIPLEICNKQFSHLSTDEEFVRADILSRYCYSHYDVCNKTPKIAADCKNHRDDISDLGDSFKDKFRITSDDVVLEVGAYLGFGTLWLAERAGKVIAIEGDKSNFHYLCLNLFNNKIDNVWVFNIWAGKEKEKLPLYFKGFQQKSFNPLVILGEEKEVETFSLDILFEKIFPPTIIFLEVNGWEYEVLQGLEKILENPVSIIAAGWYNYRDMQVSRWIEQMLLARNFEVYIGSEGKVYATNR